MTEHLSHIIIGNTSTLGLFFKNIGLIKSKRQKNNMEW
jgi:hypothetical protein